MEYLKLMSITRGDYDRKFATHNLKSNQNENSKEHLLFIFISCFGLGFIKKKPLVKSSFWTSLRKYTSINILSESVNKSHKRIIIRS